MKLFSKSIQNELTRKSLLIADSHEGGLFKGKKSSSTAEAMILMTMPIIASVLPISDFMPDLTDLFFTKKQIAKTAKTIPASGMIENRTDSIPKTNIRLDFFVLFNKAGSGAGSLFCSLIWTFLEIYTTLKNITNYK